jgi:Rod binding domain-containing protein
MSEILKPIVNNPLPVAMKGSQATRYGQSVPEGDKEKVCEGFESYFILNILKEMEKTIHISKKGFKEQTYMSIVYEKAADFLAHKGIGIKEMLMKYADQGNAKVLKESGDNILSKKGGRL